MSLKMNGKQYINMNKPNRPLKYGEETITANTRIPKSKLKAFRILVKTWLKKFEIKKK